MFPAMRRSRQALSAGNRKKFCSAPARACLPFAGGGRVPVCSTLNFVYAEGKLYFHCAREGHKLDALRRCPKASFCVVDEDRVVPQEYTSYFRSVIAFGTVRELTDEAEKRAAIETLARKYAPEADPGRYRSRDHTLLGAAVYVGNACGLPDRQAGQGTGCRFCSAEERRNRCFFVCCWPLRWPGLS